MVCFFQINNFRHVGGFFWVIRFPRPIKLHYDIAEILLKVALNTIALTLSPQTSNAFNFVHGYNLI